MKIAFYVTSHGFGHASRISALVKEFIKLNIKCFIVTDKPKFLFPPTSNLCRIVERKTDIGMFQKDWKNPSVEETFSSLEEFWVRKDEIVETESNFLRNNNISLVVVDVPYLPIKAGKKVGIKVFSITNFDWYFNYIELVNEKTSPQVKEILAEIYQIYQMCDKSFILPFSSEKSVQALPNQVKCGNLANYCESKRQEILAQYNIPKEKKIALITFGGIESDMDYLYDFISQSDYYFFTNFPLKDLSNVICLPREFNFWQLISSCDVVITKVGYSTLAETCSVGTYLCYATRENFPEDKPLVSELQHYPHSQKITLDEGSIKIALPQDKLSPYKSERFIPKNKEIALTMLSSYLHDDNSDLQALIDLGTNNSSLMIYSPAKLPQIVFYDVIITGIGLNFNDGMIAQESLNNAYYSLASQLDILEYLQLVPLILVTNIGRKAKNFYLFQEKVNKRYQVKWRIISGQEEANLGLASCLPIMKDKENFYCVDIGGSSTEISLVTKTKPKAFVSLDCGILKYYNRFRNSDYDYEQISEYIHNDIKKELDSYDLPFKASNFMCGIGKVFHNLACIYQGMNNYDYPQNACKYNVNEFLKKLYMIKDNISQFSYHDYDGTKLDTKIFYISLGIVGALFTLLSSEDLIINPWGIEYGYIITKEEKI